MKANDFDEDSPAVTDQISTPDTAWSVVPVPAAGGDKAPLPYRQAKVLVLVLAARQIPYRLSPSATGWQLLVPEMAIDRARTELEIYLRENRDWPPSPVPLPDRQSEMAWIISPLFLLAIFHNIVVSGVEIPMLGYPAWISSGSMDDVKVLAGEWWRTVTALTLHADGVHLISNLFFGGLFLHLLSLRIGLGWAWVLAVTTGAGGNLLNALMQGDHRSIGASTAVFGVLGLLSGMSAWLEFTALRRWFLPLASGLALLALFGTGGERTDIGAHLCGYLFGFFSGLMVALVLVRRGDFFTYGGIVPSLTAWGMVVVAWWLALSSSI